MQYIFDGEEHEVEEKAHGNLKDQSTTYHCMSHSTIERLKVIPKVDPPQIKQKSKNEKHEYPIMELIDMLTQGSRDQKNAFIQKVETASDPCVVLTTDQQCKVEWFCMNPSQFSVLGVDPTFNFGKFYITVTTYRHLLLRNKYSKNPVRIRPVLVQHEKRTFELL